MASTALEEKIEKIRLRNEEIKRRYEEVEADKKNAAKLDALVKPVPVEDWPERKEPPEFSAVAPKNTNKLKHSVRKHNDQQSAQYYTGSGDGKKAHNFGDGQGPPPDPKYNFLADSEREEHGEESQRDTERNRGRNKPTRGVFRRRGSGRDWHSKEQWNQQGSPGDANRPDYEAWRAERNRIDEARISRQRTAEGNWRREWDNDKVHLADEVSKRENRVTLGDVVTRQEHENEKFYRPPRTMLKNSQHSNARESFHGPETNKLHGSVGEPEKRVVIATDRNIKVVVNSGSTPPKSSVMSVKVSSSNIAGTGRVGPRQRPRVMYSSQSEAETSIHEVPNFTRQKSAEEKSKNRPNDHTQKSGQPKSPHQQRKREVDPKSPYPQRKDNDRAEKNEGIPKSGKKDSQKSPYPQRRGNAPANYPPKSPRINRRSTEGIKNDFAKSPRAHQDRNREKRIINSGSEESEEKKNKSEELLSDVDNMNREIKNVPKTESFSGESSDFAKSAESDEKFYSHENIKNSNEPEEESSEKSNEKVLEAAENNSVNEIIEQSESEISAISAVPETDNQFNSDNIEKNVSQQSEKMSVESTSNSSENVVNETEKQKEIAHTSSMISEESVSSGESNAAKESNEVEGKASGSGEAKATSSDDFDAGSSSNEALINCSANSGLNDSGFIELPSNDSIHNISDNANLETSDFAETSVDSTQSENEVIEINPVIENAEIQSELSDAAIENVAGPSSSDTEKSIENSSVNVPKEVTEISQNEPESSSTTTQKLQKVEEDSIEHSNVHKNEANVIEKSSNEVDSIESEKEQTSNALKSDEKVLEKTEFSAEGAKDTEKLENKSNEDEIASENSNIDQQIESVDEKSNISVSKNQDDINEGKNGENTAE